MVGEEEHLCPRGQFSQHLEAGSRSGVVEVDEQVVGHERQGGRMVEIVFHGSDSQREIELVRRSVAHARDGDHFSARPQSDQVGPVPGIVIAPKFGEGTSGDGREEFTGAPEKRSLLFPAIPVDGPPQQQGGGPYADIALRDLADVCEGFLSDRFLPGRHGVAADGLERGSGLCPFFGGGGQLLPQSLQLRIRSFFPGCDLVDFDILAFFFQFGCRQAVSLLIERFQDRVQFKLQGSKRIGFLDGASQFLSRPDAGRVPEVVD